MISLTVPIFNEEENILPLYEKLVPVLAGTGRPWEIIYVNDGSTDNSASLLDHLAEQDQRVVVLHFRRNYGQTAAMMAGFDYARGEVIIPIDGDLQNDPGDIPKLLARLDEGYDVASGWRKKRKDHKISRTLPSNIANKLISLISGVHLHDYGCTLKAYRKDIIKGVKLYGEMHRFLPIYATWEGARVTEIPVAHYPRVSGKSKYGMGRVVKVILDMIVIKFLSCYTEKPMHLFGSFGLISFLFSGIFLAWALYLKFEQGTSLVQTPLPLLVTMTFLTGVSCILMGLLAELSTRIYHECQDKSVYSIRDIKNTQMVDTISNRRDLKAD
jgi:glycosyltransferase involved in cell wall biosynthesis